MKNSFFSAAASGAYQYRIIIGWSGEEYSAANWTTGRLQAAELFLPLTTSWLVNGIINPKAFTVLHDETIDINSQVVNTTDVVCNNITVNFNNTPFLYQATGSTYGKTRNLYMVAIGVVAGGVSGVTAVGTLNTAVDLIFK